MCLKQILLFSAVAWLCGNSGGQTSPKLLPFQGRLTDQNGIAVSDGARLIQFKVFDAPTGGTPVWAGELHRTTVNEGVVNVLLGSKAPFTGVDFDRPLYLEITIDASGPNGIPDNAISPADPPLLPRQVILPTVFAKEAADSRKLNGYDWGSIFGVNNPTGPLPPSKIAEASLPATKLAAQSITAAQIAPASLTADRIAPRTITAAQIGAASITTNELAKAVLDLLVPPGTIVAFAGPPEKVPSGWLLCDGNNYSRTDPKFAALYNAIGTSWGFLNSGDFLVPDLRGLFLRGADHASVSRDPERDARTNLLPNGNTSGVGSYQGDQYRSHQHATAFYNGREDWWIGPLASFGTAIGSSAGTQYPLSLTKAAGGTESRPKNVYVNYIIKF